MISKMKMTACIMIMSGVFLSCSSCESEKQQVPTVPPIVFGANYDWIHLAAYTVEYGDIIRDRSFRSEPDVANKVQVWGPILNGGTVSWNNVDSGDTSPLGGKSYPGYVELARGSVGYTGITQQIIGSVKSGQSYQITFSSYGAGSADAEVYIYSSAYAVLASSAVSVANGSWTQHSITLTPSADEVAPILAIYLRSAGIIRIDEVRMFRSGSEPLVKAALKTAIQNLGVKSLRWPGGTLSDWFFWKDSIGQRISRGELQAYNYYETPALGLHEFLNLCEELNIEPLVQVNVLDTAAGAADLVEYILGPSSGTQGAVRAANGRVNPWNVQYFEIGNEPSQNYSGGSVPNTGANYAALANAVISAMKIKAGSIGKTIKLSAISEPGFQLADWLVPGVSDALDLLYYWNTQVFDAASGVLNADFTNGHFYSSRYYNADEEINFRFAMSGGELLKKTISAKIKPVTSLPLWLTEYHVVIENGGVVQANYLKDFQSGLAIADILMSVIAQGLPGAHIYNLIDTNGFGIILDPEAGRLRPGGHVFRLFSVMANEELLDISVDDNSSYTFAAGAGNVPAGFNYPLITALATRNSATGKARVMLLNRDYANDITLNINLEGFTAGSADVYRYENVNLGANNETTENVSVITESRFIDSPFVITVPAHSLWRIDFK